MQEVRDLMSIKEGNLDLALVEEYFSLFQMTDVYEEIKGDQ